MYICFCLCLCLCLCVYMCNHRPIFFFVHPCCSFHFSPPFALLRFRFLSFIFYFSVFAYYSFNFNFNFVVRPYFHWFSFLFFSVLCALFCHIICIYFLKNLHMVMRSQLCRRAGKEKRKEKKRREEKRR
ncbi:hypothetical protein, unlikely [Trypanosoma brucei brucei TREU927]|uniref:T. brucei spp.-specific protein n=1 Tax=Trypanosoma brucei brucei (strain 927/4 GUTat10.1) TaxID=185431 RepID=Q4GYE3_TRYB2|nr:hypothetical protein, unlikely [Trypanosoma brucei brucei TREU927]CAJ16641.1 hypothetical protein, unlikely [Trypanosoma brucei brucei TREU927]